MRKRGVHIDPSTFFSNKHGWADVVFRQMNNNKICYCLSIILIIWNVFDVIWSYWITKLSSFMLMNDPKKTWKLASFQFYFWSSFKPKINNSKISISKCLKSIHFFFNLVHKMNSLQLWDFTRILSTFKEMSRRITMLSPWLYFIIKTLFTVDKHPFPVTGVMSSEKTSLSLFVWTI